MNDSIEHLRLPQSRRTSRCALLAFSIALLIAIVYSIESLSAAQPNIVQPGIVQEPLQSRFGPYDDPILEPAILFSREPIEARNNCPDCQNNKLAPIPVNPYAASEFYGFGYGYGFRPYAGLGWYGGFAPYRFGYGFPYGGYGSLGFGAPYYRPPFVPNGYWYTWGHRYPRGLYAPGYRLNALGNPLLYGYYGPEMATPGYHTYGPYSNQIVLPENAAPGPLLIQPGDVQSEEKMPLPPSPPTPAPENSFPGHQLTPQTPPTVTPSPFQSPIK